MSNARFEEEARPVVEAAIQRHAPMGFSLPALADHLTVVLSGWMADLDRAQRSIAYYQNLLDRCGAVLGPEAYLCDDGTVADRVLRAKVPELVARLAALTPRDYFRGFLQKEKAPEQPPAANPAYTSASPAPTGFVGSPWAEWPNAQLVRELRNRIDYFYRLTDGSFNFPNTAHGDILKMAKALLDRFTDTTP